MADDYKVTSQRQRTVLQGDQFVPSMEVSFVTTDGTPGSVNIPLGQFGADAVKQAIEARVKDIKAVSEL